MLRMKALEPAAKVQGTSLRMNFIFSRNIALAQDSDDDAVLPNKQ